MIARAAFSIRLVRTAMLSALAGLAGSGLILVHQSRAEPMLITIPDANATADDASESDTTVESDAAAESALTCEPAITAAAAAHEMPADLLLAIGMVESGLTPWVLNAEGTPHFYDDMATAVAELDALRTGGMASIDVGCMQVNLRWHPDAFADSTAAVDPATNANYAAKFLLSLYAMTGSWTDAVAYYHSSAQRYQRPYVCAVAARLEEMGSTMTLDCLPGDEVDIPQVAESTPPTIATATAADSGPQHMVRIAPAAGSAPAVVRGQDAPPEATDSAGPRTNAGPRVIRLQ